jgi:hypothetical protein
MRRTALLIPVCCLAFAALAVPAAVWAAEGGKAASAAARKDFPGVEKLMTAEDFTRAGLDQLTPEQLQALDAWLLRYTAGDAYVVQSTSEEVRAAVPDFRLEARIVPPFTGWSGETLFRLDNGQVWRQRIKGRYLFSGEDTRVVITRNFLGFFMLTLPATGRSVGVEPVRKDGGARTP